MTLSPPVSVWLAVAFAGSILAWGYSQVSDLVRHGDVNVFHAFLTLAVFISGLLGYWAMRWWGLALAALAAFYVSTVSPVGGHLGAVVTMMVFFVPLAIVANVNRSQFKW